MEMLDRLSRTDFSPPPAVDSVLLWMHQRPRPLLLVHELELYRALLDAVFLHPQSSLQRGLRPWFSKLQFRRLGADLHFSEDASPGDLGFQQCLGLVRFILSHR
jgi:23S rRNA (adenine-N6)-dimethyltransferase